MPKQVPINKNRPKRDKNSEMTRGENLRVRRTQKLLREALVELIEERGFDALTVGEITERAMVSRAAFYRNYQDKYDLVERIFDEQLRSLTDAVADLPREHPPQVFVKFFQHVAEYEPLYRALLGRKGSPWFVFKMRASLAKLVQKHGPIPDGHKSPSRPPFPLSDDMIPDLISTMLIEAITWWLEKNKPITPKEMATRCALLISALLKEASTWK